MDEELELYFSPPMQHHISSEISCVSHLDFLQFITEDKKWAAEEEGKDIATAKEEREYLKGLYLGQLKELLIIKAKKCFAVSEIHRFTFYTTALIDIIRISTLEKFLRPLWSFILQKQRFHSHQLIL